MAINDLADSSFLQTLTMSSEKFNTSLLSAFPDPVILLNRSRQVIFANQAAIEILDGAYEGRDLSVSFRMPDILDAVDAVLKSEAIREVQVSLPIPIPRNLKVRIVRVAEEDENSDVIAMMVLYDVSSETLAVQMRQDFVANVSHELRSPIASLIGFIETLQGPAKDDSEARDRFLTIMAEESQRMARMIDDLLSLSRVEASERLRPREQVHIVELVQMTCELLSGRADDRAMKLEIEFEPDLPEIAGDRDELMEVFQNLIDNAIKYGRADTPINIKARRVARIPDVGGEGIAVDIKNLGEGIAPEHIPRLTERFYRVDKGRSRKLGGTGLGLAIVKHIINRHRGRFSVESAVGQSATFTVFLPV